jgi:hypothetical protein
MDRRASALRPLSMKAHPHRVVVPFFLPGTPVVALGFGSGYRTGSLTFGTRHLRSSFRLENLSDRFRIAPGALAHIDPRIFARVEARSRAVFVRGTRLGHLKK